MSALTGLLYTVLLAYLGGWYLGQWSGNFALLLFLLTVVSGAYWLAERLHFAPARAAAAGRLAAEHAQRQARLREQGFQAGGEAELEGARRAVLAQPWWLDWTAGLFPVILVVFLLRSFLFEPFKIPSGSMIPTLTIGDLILVNKYHYGIRLPVVHTQLVRFKAPERGDVIVFRYPVDERVDYIKRIVGLPGDVVAYQGKRLLVNGQEVPRRDLPEYYDPDSLRYSLQFEELLPRQDGGSRPHRILNDRDRSGFVMPMPEFRAHRDACQYSAEGMRCTVPAGHLFVMGDNRDNSQDSRFWGFVPEGNIVGKAFLVWMNFGNLARIGRFD